MLGSWCTQLVYSEPVELQMLNLFVFQGFSCSEPYHFAFTVTGNAARYSTLTTIVNFNWLALCTCTCICICLDTSMTWVCSNWDSSWLTYMFSWACLTTNCLCLQMYIQSIYSFGCALIGIEAGYPTLHLFTWCWTYCERFLSCFDTHTYNSGCDSRWQYWPHKTKTYSTVVLCYVFQLLNKLNFTQIKINGQKHVIKDVPACSCLGNKQQITSCDPQTEEHNYALQLMLLCWSCHVRLNWVVVT